MKKDRTEYLIDSFIDFEGKEHKIVACALSETPEPDGDYTMNIGWVDDTDYVSSDDINRVTRMVTIGVAVCNPLDDFNEEFGKKIAYNKAKNCEGLPTLYADTHGVINSAIVRVFLRQEVDFIKRNPERAIPGYDAAKAKYERTISYNEKYSNLDDFEADIVDSIINGEIDIDNLIDIAKNFS